MPCRVYGGGEEDWLQIFSHAENTIFFIDEGYRFIFSKDFADLISGTDNYYVLITRRPLTCLPYSINEIYGIRTTGKYHFPQQIYHEFYPLYQNRTIHTGEGSVVFLVEDSKSGFQFVSACCGEENICISAGGNSNIYNKLTEIPNGQRIIVLADGAAFGAYIAKALQYAGAMEDIALYFPESFEWLILRSGVLQETDLQEILKHPEDYIDSRKYISWERFFTDYLESVTEGDAIRHYKKAQLGKFYLEGKNRERIIDQFPEAIREVLQKQ